VTHPIFARPTEYSSFTCRKGNLHRSVLRRWILAKCFFIVLAMRDKLFSKVTEHRLQCFTGDLFSWYTVYHFSVRYLLSPVRLSVCLSSATFVRPTQAAQIFRNISTALSTLAIR